MSDTSLTLRSATDLQPVLPLATAANAADDAARSQLFARYRSRLAEETRRRHGADLALFATFLADAGVTLSDDLRQSPTGWTGITWGIVEAFVAWQLQRGYAIGSVNVRLSTIKSYAKLATKAQVISGEDYAQIKLVSGMRHREGVRVDAARAQTRTGNKKAEPIPLTSAQAALLKTHPNPQRRLALCLLLDHGLRVGELVALRRSAFDLTTGELQFYRSKVDTHQTHELSDDAFNAADVYFADLPVDAPLFPRDRTVRTWVRNAGAAIGVTGLSPHDLRHFWATAAIAGGTDLKALQDAGGWASVAMPLAYAVSSSVANEGVKLGYVGGRRSRRPRG